jgi:hypothetical protein
MPLAGAKEVRVMHEAARKAIEDIQEGRQVVCTLEEYYTIVRMALQRYAVAQAAQGHPEIVARITGELTRLDTAQAQGWWPGVYRSRWERLFVWVGRRYATRFLGRRYYRRAHGVSSRLVKRLMRPFARRI